MREMSKALLKKLGLAIAPEWTLELLSARSQRLIMRIERDTGCLAASHQFVKAFGRTVLRGPFAGLRYPARVANERNLVHRLVGSYERELNPWIEEIVATAYPRLIDVGTADGFYAVGFAMRMPKTEVIGFDTDLWARGATKELAEENGVANVAVKSMCTPVWVRDNLPPGALIFSDCEGYESVLLDPEVAPNLRRCDMVVELHDRAEPGIESTIRQRFRDSHEIRMVTYADRDPGEFPEMEVVPVAMRRKVISEGRGGPQNVLYMKHKQ
jgi:hypothetical protein